MYMYMYTRICVLLAYTQGYKKKPLPFAILFNKNSAGSNKTKINTEKKINETLINQKNQNSVLV